MKEQKFIPILLGSDRNVYGLAIGFYEQYHIKSIAVCKKKYNETRYSKLIKFYKNIDNDKKDVLFATLRQIKEQYPQAKLIILTCSDVYTRLVIENKEELEKDFIVPYINKDLMEKLIIKENFYKTCEKYHLNYPKTVICNKDNYQKIKIDFEYPIIVKPSDSVSYWKSSFEGKKKIFVLQSEDEFRKVLNDIYSSTYDKDFIIQEYIPGDDTSLRVLNAYVNSKHKVTFMALGNIILEDKAPDSYGDYDAIIPTYDKKLFDKIKGFLEEIKYTGFANFDLKYNKEKGTYTLFEINIRQGRSHSFVTLGGMNITKYLVDDVIYHKDTEIEYLNNKYLWTLVPKKLLLTYVKNEEILKEIKEFYENKKVKNLLYYKKDLCLIRFLILKRRDYYSFKKYQKYYK